MSEKRGRREGEQTGGDPESHDQEQEREAAAGEFSERCKSKSLLTNRLLLNACGNIDLSINFLFMSTDKRWKSRDSCVTPNVQHA